MKFLELIKNKNFQIGVSAIVIGVSAYLTRNYWMPSRGSIKVGNVDWDNRIVPTSVILQGQKFDLPDYETKYENGKGYTERYLSNSNNFTVGIDSIENNSIPVFMVTVYKGKLEGIPTSDYDKITLASVLVDFNDKKIYDMVETKKQNKWVEASN